MVNGISVKSLSQALIDYIYALMFNHILVIKIQYVLSYLKSIQLSTPHYDKISDKKLIKSDRSPYNSHVVCSGQYFIFQSQLSDMGLIVPSVHFIKPVKEEFSNEKRQNV